MPLLAPVEPLQDSRELREEIIVAAPFLVNRGPLIGTWGNTSVRVEHGVVVAPSAVGYASICPEDVVAVSWEGVRIKGERRASSEPQTHRVLLTRPEMVASVHTTSPMRRCARRLTGPSLS